ncbi:MAG: LexA family transcriptional regulator [Arcticibacter sp.]
MSDKSLILNTIKSHYNFSSDAEFARYLGIKPNTLANWYSRNTIDYEKIITKCEDLDGNWLLTGEGQITKRSTHIPEANEEFVLKTDRRQNLQRVPLYNIEAAAGLVKLFDKQQDVLDYISIPNLPKCDGAVYVAGDSMYPLLKSGDIVMYKQVNDIANGLFWGEMYLLSVSVDDDEFTLVKYIQKSDLGSDYVKLVSQNSHHAPKDVHIKDIRALAYIKASIRVNSMT